MSTASETRRPQTVTAALVLLWLALALMVAGSLVYIFTNTIPVPLGDIGLAFLGYALVAVLVVGIARGNLWARLLFLVVLAWSAGLFVINVVLASAQLLGLVLVDVSAMALQLCATLLLFARPGDAWFRDGSPTATEELKHE